MRPLVYYRPARGRFGDPIPFYFRGTWHIFYLDYKPEFYNHAPPGARHTTWAHITSRNLRTFQVCPTAISPGVEGEVDSASCATGSIIEESGWFHMYYTGRYFSSEGRRRETICHAVSRDLCVWQKDGANPIATPDGDCYARDHWRDPFVFHNAGTLDYWMIVSSELREGPRHRRGCLALMRSPDLVAWHHAGTFWDAGRPVPECPDLFFWHGHWYLLYSVEGRTLYRRSRGLGGPWEAVHPEALDGGCFYAGKSAGDHERRLLFGWVPDKSAESDEGCLEWGGNLAIREMTPDGQGGLRVAIPQEHIAKAHTVHSDSLFARAGAWASTLGLLRVSSPTGFGYATISDVASDGQVRVTIKADAGTGEVGLFVRTDGDLSGGIRAWIDLRHGYLGLAAVDGGLSVRGTEIRRELGRIGGDLDCIVTMSGSIIDVCVGGVATLVGRFYGDSGATVALSCTDGSASFSGLQVPRFSTKAHAGR